jgi:hypothetical protein
MSLLATSKTDWRELYTSLLARAAAAGLAGDPCREIACKQAPTPIT